MAEAKTRTMTVEEFYQWRRDHDERYELVDGVPTLLRAVTGAGNVHDVILVSCIIELGNRLRGKLAASQAPTQRCGLDSRRAPAGCDV